MRFVFLTAAVFAAIVEHRLTEALSRAGVFGSAYASYEHVAVQPSLLFAALAFAVLAGVSFREHAARDGAADWILRMARRGETIPVFRTALVILVMQTVALFVMESIEQLHASGRIEAGSAWLGAPIVFALPIALAMAFAIVAALRSGLSLVVAAARAIAVCIELAISVAPRACAIVTLPGNAASYKPVVPVLASRSGLRAPPVTL